MNVRFLLISVLSAIREPAAPRPVVGVVLNVIDRCHPLRLDAAGTERRPSSGRLPVAVALRDLAWSDPALFQRVLICFPVPSHLRLFLRSQRRRWSSSAFALLTGHPHRSQAAPYSSSSYRILSPSSTSRRSRRSWSDLHPLPVVESHPSVVHDRPDVNHAVDHLVCVNRVVLSSVDRR